MGTRRLLALTLPLAMLAGCVHEVAVAVARRGDRVAFTVTLGGDSPPCVTSLSVMHEGSDIGTTPPLWEVSTAQPGRCRASFNYGEVPEGYAQGHAAAPLTVGDRYLVEVAGPGVMGGKVFEMRAGDGPLTAPSASN